MPKATSTAASSTPPAKRGRPATPTTKASATSTGQGTPKTGKRQRIDWEAVERDYRTGKFTLRELASKHGATHTTIARRAEKQLWTKDLTDAIRQATNAKLIEAATQQACTSAHQNATDAVLGAAELNKQVILGQRSRVGRAVDVSMRMLDELDATTTKAAEFKGLFDMLTDGMDEKALDAARAKFNDLMRLHTRVGSAQKLMDALNRAQIMERQAFSIDDNEGQDDERRNLPLEFVEARHAED